ncbi:MAG: class I SAM-dependent methyltransferase [Cyanobacteria bacterium P01_H01_bin.105]
MKKTIDQFHADTYNNLFSFFDTYDKGLIQVLKSLLSHQPEYIVDLACGVGLSTLALHSNFNKSKILGIDIDSNLIDLAREALPYPGIEFQCREILDALSDIPQGTVDMIFVKSAYHYFEHQVTLSHLQPSLSKNGVIVIAERTSRSAKSYPLPEIASSYWENIFTEPRPTGRFNNSVASGLPLSVSCYGKQVKLPAKVYLDAVKKNQLVGLWMLKPEVIDSWIEKIVTQGAKDFNIFEEFWLYVYHNQD